MNKAKWREHIFDLKERKLYTFNYLAKRMGLSEVTLYRFLYYPEKGMKPKSLRIIHKYLKRNKYDV